MAGSTELLELIRVLLLTDVPTSDITRRLDELARRRHLEVVELDEEDRGNVR